MHATLTTQTQTTAVTESVSHAASPLRRVLFCMCVFQMHREWRWALYIAAMIVGVAIIVLCIVNADRMEQSQVARFVQSRLLVPVKLAR